MTPHIAVISAGRPGAPVKMHKFLNGLPPATWYVPDDEVHDYRNFADIVVPGGGLVEARNAALDDADALEMPCLQLSDDLTRLQAINSGGQAVDVSLRYAIDVMSNALAMTPGARMAGVAPTSNVMFGKRAINDHGFCVGDMILTWAHEPLRFDSALRLKEDYDYTAQHLAAYGKVARVDWILATFAHRSNPGGAVAYRTSELEKEAIATLKAKWPDVIKDNVKRPDEILFRWPSKVVAGGFDL